MAFQGDSIFWVDVQKVVPNPFQPRREFDEAKLQELSESIRMYGVMQPLTVTRQEVQRDDGTFYTEYELIAGERRLRASRLAGIAQVPVIIREGEESEQEKLELAIIENLQREDLNAVDRALAFKQLADQFKLSHVQVAKKVGRSREYVSNSIRLLALPEHMLDALKRGEYSEGHARTLLMLSDRPEEQEVIFREILLKKMSVRETERIIRKIATDKVRKKTPGELDSNLIELEKQFTETLGTRVQIMKTDFGGKLTIDYFSEEDLEGLLARVAEDRKKQKDRERTAEAAAMAGLAAATPVVAAQSAIPTGPTMEQSAVAEHVTPPAAPLPANEPSPDVSKSPFPASEPAHIATDSPFSQVTESAVEAVTTPQPTTESHTHRGSFEAPDRTEHSHGYGTDTQTEPQADASTNASTNKPEDHVAHESMQPVTPNQPQSSSLQSAIQTETTFAHHAVTPTPTKTESEQHQQAHASETASAATPAPQSIPHTHGEDAPQDPAIEVVDDRDDDLYSMKHFSL